MNCIFSISLFHSNHSSSLQVSLLDIGKSSTSSSLQYIFTTMISEVLFLFRSMRQILFTSSVGWFSKFLQNCLHCKILYCGRLEEKEILTPPAGSLRRLKNFTSTRSSLPIALFVFISKIVNCWSIVGLTSFQSSAINNNGLSIVSLDVSD